MSNNKAILGNIDFPKSPWQEEAQYRADNKKWLRRSQAISLAILRRIRELGITQKDLAERMQVSPQQIHKWVKGTENFRLETISKLEEALQFEMLNIIGISKADKHLIPVPVDEYYKDKAKVKIDIPSKQDYKCIPLNGEVTYSGKPEPRQEAYKISG